MDNLTNYRPGIESFTARPMGSSNDFDALYSALASNSRRVLKETRVETFDLCDIEDKKRFESTILELYKKIRLGLVLVHVNERAIFTRKDGSQTWMRYLEWSEFEDTESAPEQKIEEGELHEKSSEKIEEHKDYESVW